MLSTVERILSLNSMFADRSLMQLSSGTVVSASLRVRPGHHGFILKIETRHSGEGDSWVGLHMAQNDVQKRIGWV